MARRLVRPVFVVAAAVAAVLSCRPASLAYQSGVKDAVTPGDGKFCAAIRGNGHYLFAHYGSLAAIVEQIGIPEGVAGGSSGSITSFVYESMLKNPSVKNATGDQKRKNLALLLKSILGYVKVLSDSDEGQALRGLIVASQAAQQTGNPQVDAAAAAAVSTQLQTVLNDPEGLRALVNPRLVQLLQNRNDPHYQFNVQESKIAVTSLGKFDATDEKIMFREGAINYDALTVALGRLGDFYAAYGSVDQERMSNFVNTCSAVPGTWTQVASANNGQCNTLFTDLVRAYRAQPSSTRLEEPVGGEILAILTAAQVTGAASITAFDQAMARYKNEQPPNFKIDFESVRFGYWVPEAYQSRVREGLASRYGNDEKSRKFLLYNEGRPAKWKEALRYSTMEPGVSKLEKISPTAAFAGGWADLFPVQVLKAAGCDKVIYVQRRGPDTKFVSKNEPIVEGAQPYGVAQLLGLRADVLGAAQAEAVRQKIYAWENPNSSYSRAIADASGVWCTDWDSETNTDFVSMWEHAYNAPGVGLAVNDEAAFPGYAGPRVTQATPGCKR
jgi:hypothetical protein